MVTLDDFRDLQRILATEKQISVFWHAFFDLFDREPLSIMEISRPWEDTKTFNQLLEAIGMTLQQKVLLVKSSMLWIAEARLAHGHLVVSGKMMTLIYFAETNMGSFTFAMDNGQQGFARFTITPQVDPTRRM